MSSMHESTRRNYCWLLCQASGCCIGSYSFTPATANAQLGSDVAPAVSNGWLLDRRQARAKTVSIMPKAEGRQFRQIYSLWYLRGCVQVDVAFTFICLRGNLPYIAQAPREVLRWKRARRSLDKALALPDGPTSGWAPLVGRQIDLLLAAT